MSRFGRIASNLIFSLLCVLTLLLILEQYVDVPNWLQAVGRMHPLMLHFPIVLIFLLVLLAIFGSGLEASTVKKITRFLLLLTAFTTVLTTLMGFFLYQEGYDSEEMSWHKWLGVGLAYVAYLLLFIQRRQSLYKSVLFGTGILTVFIGHFGASITHGSNFLTEPLIKEQKLVVTEETPIFLAYVEPVLKKKCVSCHNAQKHKGGLDMSTFTAMLRGGESGRLWSESDSTQNEIIRRALLPLEDDEHMPPEGKAQLTQNEIDFIAQWISAGADSSVAAVDLAETHPLKELINKQHPSHSPKKTEYAFAFADPSTIETLNNPYRTVIQKSPNSPAIEAVLFGRGTFTPESLENLSKIAEQLVVLNLSHLPVEDAHLQALAQFSNLEHLQLNFTKVTEKGLQHITSCTKLKSLALSGTSVKGDLATVLKHWPDLEKVFLWNTSVSNDMVAILKTEFPQVDFILGQESDTTEMLELGVPFIENKSAVLLSGDKIYLNHKLTDTEIRYTLDGTEPDSLSTLYSDALQFSENFELKARAFKKGWKPSSVASFSLFRKGVKPVSLDLLTMPLLKNRVKRAQMLIDDYIGGEKRLMTLAWLGFTDEPLIAMADFGETPPKLSKILLSYGIESWRGILPPGSVEIWAGNDKDRLKLLNRKTMALSKTKTPAKGTGNITLEFTPATYRYYKVIGRQIERIPQWHQRKGNRSTLYIDELFFYE